MAAGSRFRAFSGKVKMLLTGDRKRLLEEAARIRKIVVMLGQTKVKEIACNTAYELLDRYVDRVLEDGDQAELVPELKDHLEKCMCCRQEYEALLEMMRGYPSWG